MDEPNILLITVDCLRADHMSCYGYHRKTTPFIDDICNRSTIYMNHMSNGPTTPNSFPSIMCSRYRLEMPGLELPKKWITIAEMLKEINYNTIGMSSRNPWTSEYFGFNKGFDSFRDYMETSPESLFEAEKMGGVARSIKHIYDIINGAAQNKKIQDLRFGKDVIDKLKDMKKPWFMWVHFMDTHTEYFPEKLYYGEKRLNMTWYVMILNKIVTMNKHPKIKVKYDLIDLYDSAMRQIDEIIGKMMSMIDNDIMVVITSDHGEAFEEHGRWTHQHYSMYNELLKAPLIIHYPNQQEQEIIEIPSNSVDIMPTIADVTGAFIPPIIRGESLLNGVGNRPIFHEGLRARSIKTIKHNIPRTRGVTINNKRLLVRYDPGEMQLYDLSTDPEERNNLVDSEDHIDTKNHLLSLIENMIENEKKTIQMEMT